MDYYMYVTLNVYIFYGHHAYFFVKTMEKIRTVAV